MGTQIIGGSGSTIMKIVDARSGAREIGAGVDE